MQLLKADLGWFIVIKIARWTSKFNTKEANFDLKKRLCRQRDAYTLRYCKVAPFKGEIMTCDVALQQQQQKTHSWVKTATATGYRDWSANTIVRYRKGRGYFFEEVWVRSLASGPEIQFLIYFHTRACSTNSKENGGSANRLPPSCALEMSSPLSEGLTWV